MLKPIRSLGIPVAAMLLLLVVLQGAASADLGEVECDPQDPFCDIIAGDDDAQDSGGSGASDDDEYIPGSGEESECADSELSGLPVEEWPAECLGSEPQVAAVADLAELAHDRLILPGPELATSPADRQLVHLPVWLAVSESSWTEVSASVSAGAVTVTATASPSRVEWDLGDGTTVACTGPGTQWRPGMDPTAASPDCGYTYARSSPALQVSATVFWTVAWTSSTGSGGTFADLATTASATWEVAESRSVIVR